MQQVKRNALSTRERNNKMLLTRAKSNRIKPSELPKVKMLKRENEGMGGEKRTLTTKGAQIKNELIKRK